MLVTGPVVLFLWNNITFSKHPIIYVAYVHFCSKNYVSVIAGGLIGVRVKKPHSSSTAAN